jgi:2'-5' RNA ligase
VRLFVAAEPDARLREQLAEIPRRVRMHGFRLVPPAQLHLTFRFFADVEETRVGDLVAAVRSACSTCGAFDVDVCGGGTFGPPHTPRVAWVGLTDEPRLLELSRCVDAHLADVGIPPDERRFHPHITLGRGKHRPKLEREKLRALPSCGRLRIDELVLFRSTTSDQGAVHEALARAPLAAS